MTNASSNARHPPDAPPPLSFRRQMQPLALLPVMFWLNFTTRVVLAPLMPAIERELGISHVVAGSFFLALSCGYFVAMLFSGAVSARLSHRTTILVSALGLPVVLAAAALARGTGTLQLTLVLVGMTAGIYLPSGLATLTAAVQYHHWGKAIAIHELAPNMGLITAPVLGLLASSGIGWRGVLLLLAVGSLASGLAFARWGHPVRAFGEAPRPAVLGSLLRIGAVWTMIALFSLGISAVLGVYTVLPLYLVTELGIPADRANLCLSLSRISGLIVVLAAGWLTDRMGPRTTLTLVYSLAGLFTALLGLAPTAWVIPLLFLQPLAAACFPPAALKALSAVVPERHRNVAVALVIPLAFGLGGGGVPQLMGWMGDHVSFAAGLALLGAVVLCGGLLARTLRL